MSQTVQVPRGIYQDERGSLYEVVIPEATSDELTVVIFRALFGDYRYRAAPEQFSAQDGTGATFSLVKPL